MCDVKKEIGGSNKPYDADDAGSGGDAGRLKGAINPNKSLKIHAVGSLCGCKYQCWWPGWPQPQAENFLTKLTWIAAHMNIQATSLPKSLSGSLLVETQETAIKKWLGTWFSGQADHVLAHKLCFCKSTAAFDVLDKLKWRKIPTFQHFMGIHTRKNHATCTV